jgi:RHS repeat-associated protein
MSFPSPKAASFGRRLFLRLAHVQRLLVALLFLPSLASSARAADVVEVVITDALGNIRVITDDKGNILERHDYLPFGEECTTGPCASNPGVGAGQPRKFTGKERDQETGLDYFGARYYRANTGRFTTVDPVYTWRENLVDPQRWNRYAYARNNPLRYVDPDGRAIDVLVDVGSIGYDLFDIGRSVHHGEGVSGTQWLALGGDVVGAVLPLATGIGAAIRAANKVDAATDLARAAQLAKNKQAGAAFEQVVVAQKQVEQTGVVQQLTIKTDSGVRTRLDAAGRDAAGNARLTEAKASETARLTPNQRKAFPEIGQTGGTVAGQGKPGFPGGSRIPATEVDVCRPCKQ